MKRLKTRWNTQQKTWLKSGFSWGFTLIELLITMTIFFMIVVGTYVSYSHFQKKALLRQSVKEISKWISDARNLAINGLDSWSGNVSVGLYFDARDARKTTLTYYSYPHTYSWSQIVAEDTGDIEVYKTVKLPAGTEVEEVAGHEKFLIFFSAVTWEGIYYYWDASDTKWEFLDAELPIRISFKNATALSLQKEIKYYTHGYIADY